MSKALPIIKNSLILFGSLCAIETAHAEDINQQANTLSNIEPALGRIALPLANDVTQKLDQQKITLKYDVYAGGMHALKAFLSLSETQDAYQTQLTAKTKGIIGKALPWLGAFSTMGVKFGQDYTPIQHHAQSQWKKKTKKTELSFDNTGRLQQRVYEKNARKPFIQTAFKPEITDDAKDMLSGVLVLFQQAGANKKCAGDVNIVDGKRKFKVALTDQGVEVLKKTNHNHFSGPALKCAIEVTPIAGYKEKDKKRGWMAVQSHSQERHQMPMIWLGRLENQQIVPVRMEIKSSYGTVIAHLSSINMPSATQ